MQDSSLVSVLDLDSIMPAGRTRDARRTAGISMKLMCISLYDVIDVRLDGKTRTGFTVKSETLDMVEPTGIEPVTS